MSQFRLHPSSVHIDLPAENGSLLHFVLNQNPTAKAFTDDSLLEVQERTSHGLRPLASYRVGLFLEFHQDDGFVLHDENPGLRINREWRLHLADWIEMMTETSLDVWRDES